MASEIDFDTGKLSGVARQNCRLEYALLGAVLLVSGIPYVLLFWFQPLLGLGVVLTICVVKMVVAFASSASTGLPHHVRFLLSGSNPIGMSAGASLLLGAVDAIFDWHEDAPLRQKAPFKYWFTTVVKFVTTPLGAVLMALEYFWDLVLLRRGLRLVKFKWNEFFSLAKYHGLICPEKSNDIFYADVAFARYRDSAFLYQWNRMRAMVFELQHYKLDIEAGLGSDQTNLFRVGDLAAYQILKRLEIEGIENALERHSEDHPDEFPIPAKLAERLVNSARPLEHYLRMREELLTREMLPVSNSDGEQALRELIPRRLVWQVLRLLDELPSSITPAISRHITQNDLEDLVVARVLANADAAYRFDYEFVSKFERILAAHFAVPTEEQAQVALCSKIPDVLVNAGVVYCRNDECRTMNVE